MTDKMDFIMIALPKSIIKKDVSLPIYNYNCDECNIDCCITELQEKKKAMLNNLVIMCLDCFIKNKDNFDTEIVDLSRLQ